MSERASIESWHAHVYYTDAASKQRAAKLRVALETTGFKVDLGRWHDKPVGPHPVGSYQIAFDAALFARVVPWLALNRDGLTVFVHPNTGDAIADHSNHAIWLGPSVTLNLDVFEGDKTG